MNHHGNGKDVIGFFKIFHPVPVIREFNRGKTEFRVASPQSVGISGGMPLGIIIRKYLSGPIYMSRGYSGSVQFRLDFLEDAFQLVKVFAFKLLLGIIGESEYSLSHQYFTY